MALAASSASSRSDSTPTSRSTTTTATTTGPASFNTLVTAFILGTICFAFLVVPRASSFSLSSSHSHSSQRGNKGKASIVSSLFQSSSAVVEKETSSSSTTTAAASFLMEQQAGGNNSNRRRRKHRIRNGDIAENNSNNNNDAMFNNIQKQEQFPDPLVPFQSVESVKLIVVGDDDNNDENENDSDSNARVEIRLRSNDGEGSSSNSNKNDDDDAVVVIDPRDLHQTSDFKLWMALRKNIVDVSASQLSVVLGTNYFTSRDKLLQDKITARVENGNGNDNDVIVLNNDDNTGDNNNNTRSNSKACAWGIKMEPLAFAQYAGVVTGKNNQGDADDDDDDENNKNHVEETGMYLLRHIDPVTKKTYTFGASPDGIVTEHYHVAADDESTTTSTSTTKTSVGLLEIKSLWGRRHKSSLPAFDHCPSRFYDQIQGQMAICNMEWCDLMLFIPPGGSPSGGNSSGNNKRKGKSVKKRKKQAAIAAARNKPRKTKGRNYSIVRVKRNEKYWNEIVLPALIEFCDDVETGTIAKAAEGKEVTAA